MSLSPWGILSRGGILNFSRPFLGDRNNSAVALPSMRRCGSFWASSTDCSFVEDTITH